MPDVQNGRPALGYSKLGANGTLNQVLARFVEAGLGGSRGESQRGV